MSNEQHDQKGKFEKTMEDARKQTVSVQQVILNVFLFSSIGVFVLFVVLVGMGAVK